MALDEDMGLTGAGTAFQRLQPVIGHGGRPQVNIFSRSYGHAKASCVAIIEGLPVTQLR